MKKEISFFGRYVVDATPIFIAIVIALTICSILSLNWWMSMTHYGQTDGHVQIPDILKNSLMTILGYYFGGSNIQEKISRSVKITNISYVSSFIAIIITLTVCGVVLANWHMSMTYYGKTTGIKIPDVFDHALSAILGFYFGSNKTERSVQSAEEKGEKQ